MGLSIVFMGTPEFAVPSLKMLIEEGYHIKACVSQPDRPAGRGHKLVPPPVKVLAEEHGIPVFQPQRVSGEEGLAALREFAPDVLITAAFGQILSDDVLSVPKYGCINVHASLLPKYRGAAPINWAIINGEKKTGVTTMYTVKKLDAGDILEQDECDIPNDMTAGELYARLSELGAVTLKRTLQKLEAGTLMRTPQIEEEASYFPMFKKGFGEIDFSRSREEIRNFVRGLNPFPGAYINCGDEKIRVYAVSAAEDDAGAAAGAIVCANPKRGLLVAASDGAVSLDLIKRSGSRVMNARESLCGKRMDESQRLRAGEEN